MLKCAEMAILSNFGQMLLNVADDDQVFPDYDHRSGKDGPRLPIAGMGRDDPSPGWVAITHRLDGPRLPIAWTGRDYPSPGWATITHRRDGSR